MTQHEHDEKVGNAPADQARERPLLFISYFAGIRGNCPAEWADDKIRVLESAGRRVIVLTGMSSHVADRSSVSFVRVPSLSWGDYKGELLELGSVGETPSIWLQLIRPFAFLIGVPFDFFMRKVTKGISAGRWSWLLTALPVAVWLKLRHGVRDVFCTGGPTSAHVVGGFAVRLTGGHLYNEFQDPLLGAMMTRSSMTRRISSRIEKWLVKHSTKAVYVTQEAARLARVRNPEHTNQIVAVYPGAWRFVTPAAPVLSGALDVIEFLHLGTLYGSRNLDLFFDALDALRAEGFEHVQTVRVVNLGAVYCETAPRYLARPDFQSLDALERIEALERARKASCLLLVQHVDERSRETIPYKTYDYLNLGLPVFGVLNNDELRTLIESCGGHAAQADDVESIKSALRACLSALAEARSGHGEIVRRFDISTQFLQVLECADGGR